MRVPVAFFHHFSNGLNVRVRKIFMKEIAHAVYEDSTRLLPMQGLFQPIADAVHDTRPIHTAV